MRRSAAILDVALDDGGRLGHRRALARHAARGQPPAQARARLGRGARQRRRRRRRGRRGPRACSRSTSSASTASTARSSHRSARSSRGGPVGLSTLAIAVNEEADTLEDVYEPYLLQCGLIQRTPRGRAATARAYEHLGLEPAARGRRRCSGAPGAGAGPLSRSGRNLRALGVSSRPVGLAVSGTTLPLAVRRVVGPRPMLSRTTLPAEGARAAEGAVEELLAVALDAQEGRPGSRSGGPSRGPWRRPAPSPWPWRGSPWRAARGRGARGCASRGGARPPWPAGWRRSRSPCCPAVVGAVDVVSCVTVLVAVVGVGGGVPAGRLDAALSSLKSSWVAAAATAAKSRISASTPPTSARAPAHVADLEREPLAGRRLHARRAPRPRRRARARAPRAAARRPWARPRRRPRRAARSSACGPRACRRGPHARCGRRLRGRGRGRARARPWRSRAPGRMAPPAVS